MDTSQSADDGSISGSPLVGAARDWAGNRTAKDQCSELFVRVLQMSIVCSELCYLLGLTMEEALQAGAERSLRGMGVPSAEARGGAEAMKGGSDAKPSSDHAQPDMPGGESGR